MPTEFRYLGQHKTTLLLCSYIAIIVFVTPLLSLQINETMKKKMVVKVSMNGPKCRSKALKIVASLSGVESASLKGDDKSQIELTGEGVDPVQLTRLLRKKVGYAELVSVSNASGEKKKEDEQKAYVWPYNQPYYVYDVPSYGYVQHHEPSCSIL